MPTIVKMLLARMRSWGVAIWLAIIAGSVVWGLWTQPISLWDVVDRINLSQALGSLCLILVGKILTILLVKNVLAAFGEDRGLKFAWYAYSLADIAKYLPGGIWGITGRLHILRQADIKISHGGRMLLVETVILLAFSFGVGVIILVSARLGWDWRSVCFTALIVLALGAAVRTLFPRMQPLFVVSVTVEQFLAWICFGCSFALIVGVSSGVFITMAGIFNVGFAVGTVAVFAPSGLGVREVVIAWLSDNGVEAGTRIMIELAVIHRLIWVVSDFITLVPALIFGKGTNPPAASSTPGAEK